MSDSKTITELLSEFSGYTEKELQERMTEPILQPYDVLQAVLKYVSKANDANEQPDTKALGLFQVSGSTLALAEWLIKSKQSIFLEAEIQKEDKSKILNALNYSDNIIF